MNSVSTVLSVDLYSQAFEAIAGAAAFVIVVVSCTIGWGLWMAYRTSKILSTATKTRTSQRVRRRTKVSEMAALEMGASFQRLNSCSDWEPTRLPYLQSQNSDLSKDMPALPERAYVSGWVPFPPGLPRCQTLDAARSPTLVPHSMNNICGVKGILGTSKNPMPRAEETQTSPSPPMNLINFDEDFDQLAVPPTPCVGLGLSLFDAGVTTDGLKASNTTVEHAPLERDVNLLESASENMLSIHIFDPVQTSAPLPSPLITPILPTLVLTSAPMKRILDDKPEQSNGVSQLASPPETPILLLTAPSIQGLSDIDEIVGLDVNDDLESWSDVLSFQEYEDEDMSNRASMRLLSEFPSPPESPCSVLDIPRVGLIGRDNHHCEPSSGEDHGNTVPNPTSDEHVKDNVAEVSSNIVVEDKPFDYAAFRERLAIFLKDMTAQQEKKDLTANVEDTDNRIASAPSAGDLSPSLSSSTHFDYTGLRARKRSATLFSHNDNKRASVSRIESRRIGPKPLPLPVGFQPLLPRGIERSKRQDCPAV